MPESDVLEAEVSVERFLKVEIRPHLDSFDSGQECSVDHLRELYRLLETEYQDLDGYVFDDSCLRVA